MSVDASAPQHDDAEPNDNEQPAGSSEDAGMQASGPTQSMGGDGGGEGEAEAEQDAAVSGSDASSASIACDRTSIDAPQHDTSARMYTQAQLDACLKMCGDGGCARMQCTGYSAFDDCSKREILACVAAPGGVCRPPYETLICCWRAAGCTGADPKCLDDHCQTESQAFLNCTNNDKSCRDPAVKSCLSTP